MPFGLELLVLIVVVFLPKLSSCRRSSLVLVIGFSEPKSVWFSICVGFLVMDGKFDRHFLHGGIQ